ncbi:hypothetical protein GCHA_4237 [Paraglaciecola chathamensis S18K6]|uniref:Uncharacterized protein n=1 Tax=Paraglaciecola chathamensis S18K6 TaxID=1127672 RepID=A0AAV3V6L6_9ALTE|nr:hypothetical protein GCHA_4237 [Paraglaciecola chathamensis S18K6]
MGGKHNMLVVIIVTLLHGYDPNVALFWCIEGLSFVLITA